MQVGGVILNFHFISFNFSSDFRGHRTRIEPGLVEAIVSHYFSNFSVRQNDGGVQLRMDPFVRQNGEQNLCLFVTPTTAVFFFFSCLKLQLWPSGWCFSGTSFFHHVQRLLQPRLHISGHGVDGEHLCVPCDQNASITTWWSGRSHLLFMCFEHIYTCIVLALKKILNWLHIH